MLDEVELLVARGHPEVVALVGIVIAGDAAELVDGAESGFPAERRIRQYQRCVMLDLLGQRVVHLSEFRTVCSSDAVQEQVHLRQPCGVLHNSTPRIPPPATCCASSGDNSSVGIAPAAGQIGHRAGHQRSGFGSVDR